MPARGASFLKSRSKSKNVRKPSIRLDFDFDFSKKLPGLFDFFLFCVFYFVAKVELKIVPLDGPPARL